MRGEISAFFAPSLELKLLLFLHKQNRGWSLWLNTCYQITRVCLHRMLIKVLWIPWLLPPLSPYESLLWIICFSPATFTVKRTSKAHTPLHQSWSKGAAADVPNCIKNEQFFCYRKGFRSSGGGWWKYAYTYICIYIHIHINIYRLPWWLRL